MFSLAAWATDGVVALAALAAALAATTWRDLRECPRGVGWALAAVVALGVALRVVVPVEAALDVWPYTRLMTLPRLVFEGPALAAYTRHTGRAVDLTAVVFAVTWLCAALGPLAVFGHARALLRDERAALGASLAVAVLPSALRFARSDTGFVLSAVFASLSFTLARRALHDPSPRWRVACLAALPVALLAALDTRALNMILPALLCAQAWLFGGDATPSTRRARVSGLVAITAGWYATEVFLPVYGAQAASGLRVDTLGRAIVALASPRYDTLLNPHVTPPGFVALAAVGAASLWRRGERRVLGFLLAWMALFFAANAVVLPSTIEMQSRYHLHLMAPFALLIGSSVRALSIRAWATPAAVAYALAVPVLHRGFERDVAFNDVREFAFVMSARDRVPDGCTVLEYTVANDDERRFDRAGLRVRDGRVELRWRHASVDVAPGDAAQPGPAVRALLAQRPACLVFYEGLPCADAPVCAAVRAALGGRALATVSMRSRRYDDNLAPRVAEGAPMRFTLWRAP